MVQWTLNTMSSLYNSLTNTIMSSIMEIMRVRKLAGSRCSIQTNEEKATTGATNQTKETQQSSQDMQASKSTQSKMVQSH